MMYWAFSCDVSRHIVMSSIAVYIDVTKSIGFTCAAAESWLVIEGVGVSSILVNAAAA
jgi:hypothetical protein